MKRKASFKGIPQEHRQQVREYMAAVRKAQGAPMFRDYATNPQAAYRSLKSAWKEQAERKAEEARKTEATRKECVRESKERAKHAIYPAMTKLVALRSMLSHIAGGESFAGLSEEDAAEVCEAALEQAACKLERAMIALEVLTPEQACFLLDAEVESLTK